MSQAETHRLHAASAAAVIQPGDAAPDSTLSRSRASTSASLTSRVVMLGATSIIIGVLWDISWHRTIGRDTFWTPAHMAIYLGGVLGGLSAAWLILSVTFRGTPSEKAGAVKLWGMHGPLGAWVCAWGALAMVTSAPFDNWWHDAYGLDVKILSPPHTVLALGMFAIVIGALLLVLREQNLAPEGTRPAGSRLLLYAGGVILAMVAVFLTEESWPNQQRNPNFLIISCATYPLYLLAVARASKSRWGATWSAAGYMAINCAMLWILPLFPGQPRLGPIYHHVDHFVPLAFPMLMVVPALGLDLARRWIGHGRGALRDWSLCLIGGAVFALLFIATQWHFAEFLIGPGAQNAFFGGDRIWDYTDPLTDNRFRFWDRPATVPTFLVSGALAVAACRLGLWLGNWMSRVRR